MAWLAETVQGRLEPSKALVGARAAVIVGDLYASRNSEAPPAAPDGARVARYARGRDYHTTIKRRLHRIADEIRECFPGERTRCFADIEPIHERELAVRAGLGWIGKHTLVIHPRLGSWFVLGGILTTLDLEPSEPLAEDHCGTCTRCIDACPTRAITPYSVDASRCISYLTIERRGEIDPALQPGMGSWVYGCDVCQEVCPHNTPRASAEPGPEPNPAYADRLGALPVSEVLGWTAAERSARLSGTSMKRATLAMFQRNAAIAARNAGSGPAPRDEGERQAAGEHDGRAR